VYTPSKHREIVSQEAKFFWQIKNKHGASHVNSRHRHRREWHGFPFIECLRIRKIYRRRERDAFERLESQEKKEKGKRRKKESIRVWNGASGSVSGREFARVIANSREQGRGG